MNKIISGVRKGLIVLGALVMAIFLSDNAQAITAEEVYNRVLLNSVPYCYQNALVPSIQAANYISFNSLMNPGYKQSSEPGVGMFYLPMIDVQGVNQITTTVDGGRVANCYSLFAGDPTGLGTLGGSMKGLLNNIPNNGYDVTKLNQFMTNTMKYSYDKSEMANTEYCYTVRVKETTTAAVEMEVGTFCVNEQDFPLTSRTPVNFSSGDANSGYTATGSIKQVGDRNPHYKFSITVTKNTDTKCRGGANYRQPVDCAATLDLGLDVPNEESVRFSQPQITGWTNFPDMYVEIKKNNASTNEDSRKIGYTKGNWQDFFTGLTGEDYNSSSFKFSDADKYGFYLEYLERNYGRAGSSIGSNTCQAEKPTVLADTANNKYYIYIKGSGWCLANLDENKVGTSRAMTVFSPSQDRVLDKVINTLPELIDLMGQLTYDEETEQEMEDISPGGGSGNGATEDGDAPEGEQDPCWNAGVEGMSWILCPAISNMEDTATALDDLIASWLEVDPVLYNGSSGARSVWGMMRDIANAIMIIMLLIIIFSQLTGYGIDNYGVKKMLPRLIMMAILINLSFIICQLAVDLSNILGVGLRSMFKRMAIAAELDTGVGFVSTMVTVIFTAVGVGGAVGSTMLATGDAGWRMAVIIIVVALLVVVVAVLLFFIALGARMIMVVLCTALSPVAFACFILPNTQAFFRKWWDVFKAALIMYPICGALSGISEIIRGIANQDGLTGGMGVMMGVVGLIAPYLVFFLLPSMLKGAFAAMGKIGGALTAMGAAYSMGARRAQNAVQNTERYKNAQAQSARRRQERMTQNTIRRLEGRQARRGSLSERDTRILAQARAQRVKDLDLQNREQNMMGTGYEAALANVAAKAEADQVSDYEALIGNGKVKYNDNGTERAVNVNDDKSMGAYHAEALARYHNATTEEARKAAMAQIKAAQNILSKTDKGRAQVQNNFENALRNGNIRGLSEAASHIMGAYGDTYKAKNRGLHGMISDLSNTSFKDAKPEQVPSLVEEYVNKLGGVGGGYDTYGTNKYTEETLAGADDAAIDRMMLAAANDGGFLKEEEKQNIQNTARKAIAKAESGNLYVKPEVLESLHHIVNGTLPDRLKGRNNGGGVNNGGNGGANSGNELDIPHDS